MREAKEQWLQSAARFDQTSSNESGTASTRIEARARWSDDTELEGMELAVHRAKRWALEFAPTAQFDPVRVVVLQTDPSEEVGASLVVLKIKLPEGVDRTAFQDRFYEAIARDLSSKDISRLAIQVQ
ncbi:MAG: hypothetical protein WD533_08725 [Dehalococcoidia bacterium]